MLTIRDILEASDDQRVDLLSAAPNGDAALSALVDEARSLALADPDRGLDATAALVELADRACGPSARAAARSAACQALAYANRLAEALEVGKEAVRLARTANDLREEGAACLTQVQACNLMGRRQEALTLCERAAACFTEVGLPERAGTAEMVAGVVLRTMDEAEGALRRFDTATPLLRSSPNLTAQLASNRAEALLDLGRFDAARASFETARDLFVREDLHFGAAIVEGNLADLANRQGRLRDAIRLFELARDRFVAQRDPAEAARLDAEGAEVLLYLGEHGMAIERLTASLAALEEAGLTSECARAASALGVALASDGQTDAAIRELVGSAARFRSVGQHKAGARVDAMQARVLNDAARPEDALELISSAIADLGDRGPSLARCWIDRATIEISLGRVIAARASVDEADRLRGAAGLIGLEHEIALLRAQVADELGDSSEARSSLMASVRAIEQLRGTLPGDRLRASLLRAHAATFRWGLGYACRRSADTSLAFDMMERPLARSMLDQITTSDTSPSSEAFTPTRVSGELSQIRGELSGAVSAMESDDAAGAAPLRWVSAARDRLEALEREAAQLESRAQAAAGATGLAAESARLDSIPPALDENTIAISFGYTDDAIARLAITRRGARLDHLAASPMELRSLAQQLSVECDRALARRSAGRAPSPALTARANALLGDIGRALFDGIEGELAAHASLVIVPPAGLEGVPYRAVRVNDAALILDHEVTVAPSVTIAKTLAHKSETAATRTVLVAAPDERAPRVADEVNAIRRAIAGECATLIDSEATSERASAESGDAGVVHLACHGRFSTANAMESGLRLADAWVSARALAGWRFEGATVVLSGCETGQTDRALPGEAFGLVRALLLGGARRIVASLWRADDETTSDMMARVYARAEAIERPLALAIPPALTEVQREFVTEATHPAMWAPWVSIGSWS